MSSVGLVVVALAVLFVSIALAKSSAQEPQGAQGAPGAPPGPGPEHAQLAAWVGTWNAEVECMGQVSKGVETCRMGLGGFWLLTDFEGEFMGAPFSGHGMTGFDPAKGKLVALWADSMGSPLSLAEGELDAAGKRFVATAEGLGMDGHPGRFEHVTTFEGRDRRTFEIVQLRDGGAREVAMRIRYTRRK